MREEPLFHPAVGYRVPGLRIVSLLETLPGAEPSSGGSSDYDPSRKEYFNFWTPIETNMRLASPSLFSTLEKYIDAKDVYWDALYEHANMHNAFAETPEGHRINRTFDDTRSALSLEININYKYLKNKLRPPDYI